MRLNYDLIRKDAERQAEAACLVCWCEDLGHEPGCPVGQAVRRAIDDAAAEAANYEHDDGGAL